MAGSIALLSVLTVAAPAATQDIGGPELFHARRARFATAMPPGSIAIVMSARKNQDFIYEGFVLHADNHDFIYLTGLQGALSHDSALVLSPGAEEYREILYTSQDVNRIKKQTGLVHVYPYAKFLEDLSESLTDFSLIRTHQRGAKPLSTDISRSLGANKYVYFNYPRFLNLTAAPPPRLEVAQKLQYFSPEVQMRDASDILDRLRMIHDETEIALLRKASEIAVKGLVESMKIVRPGVTTREIAAMVDYTFAAEGAEPSFSTNVGNWALGAGYAGDRELKAGDLISYDIGAEYGHQTSDFGRTIPVGGVFSPAQKKIYEAIVSIQRRLIASVKPGGTFVDLQQMKDRLVAEAGLADKTVKYGISHYVGMEIHDVGDYEIPFQPNMCFVIEWRVEIDGSLMRFEDVLLVTEKGNDWLTGMAPIDPEDYARIMVKPAASGGSHWAGK
jgi:Xaa-Pro aminopeptidase